MTIFLDDAPHVTGTVVTLILLAFLTFGMRVYCRVTRASWGMEDWLMAVSMFPFTVLSISCLVASFNGVGIHAFRLQQPGNEQYMEKGLFWFFMFEVFYCVTIIPIKLSIGYMLVRIAQNRKVYIYAQYGIMAMFTVMNLIAALYIIFQCNPVSAAWDSELMAEGTHCQDPAILADIYYATTAVNIFTDWATALIGLSNIVIWGYAENGVGVFVGNLSTLRPLFRKMLSLGGTDDSSKPTGYGASAAGLPSNKHPYQSFDNYEMRAGTSGTNGDGVTTTTQSRTCKIHGGSSSQDSLFDNDEIDSQKKMARSGSVSGRNEAAKSPGIVVSRQIEISR
ncbi:hypothetical protein PG985_012240 [Apiospora marii]|uniref:uncharacterized protein n=1 Tax=Apiospora marii TaxID=335849 RepID=UPI00312FDF05